MHVKLVYSLAAFLIFTTTIAQKQLKFSSINSGGIILGQSDWSGMFQTVNGIVYQKWFAGVGAGYDDHYYKSVPLFIDARRYLDKQNHAFLYADFGYNFPQGNKPAEQSYKSYHFTGGVYGDVGFGYEFIPMKRASVVISGGYSYKNIRSRIVTESFCINPPCPDNVSNYDYGFNRLLIKAGIMFK